MSHLGDIVCALPLFHVLREAHPGAELAWVVQREFAGLLEGLEGLQRVFPFDRGGGWRAWLRLRRDLAAFGADLAVDVQGNLKSAAALACSRAPRRVGLDRADWRERLGARWMTEAAPPCRGPHVVERSLTLARHLAPGVEPRRIDPGLGPGELETGRGELARLLGGLPAAGELWIAHLSPPGDPRSWPEHRWEEWLRLAVASGRRVLMVSGPREEDLGLRLARRHGTTAAHWVGGRHLRRLAAVFSAAAESGASYVGADSGPMHLACSVGLRVHGLEGPQDGARTGPWTLEGPRAGAELRVDPGPDCAPCLARSCHHPRGPVCMEDLEPAAVVDALAAR